MYNLLSNFYYIFKGLYLTLSVTVISLITGVILGFVMANIIFFKIELIDLLPIKFKFIKSKILKLIPSFYQIINLYKKFTTNTPIMTQLIFFLFVIPINLDVFSLGLIVLGLNSAAHVTTIILDSLNNIPENYWYTSASLGLNSYESMKKIYFKYLIIQNKKVLFNEFITLLKESSILSVFGVKDIIYRSREMSTMTYKFLPYTLFVSFLYFFIITINEYIYNKFFEKKN